MLYNPPIGGAANDSYVDANPGLGIDGSPVPAAAIEYPQRELVAVIQAAGLTPSNATLNQLLLALRSAGVFATPPQFDSTTKAATTAFVQRALGNMQTTLYAASTTLMAADAGKAVLLATVGTVMTLPLLSSVPLGSVFRFVNVTSNGAGSVVRQGSDVIYFGSTTLPSVAVNGGESLDVVAHATGWVAIGGSMSLAYASSSFGSSLATSGYLKLPSGVIVQWGTVPKTTSASVAVTWPIAFPNGFGRCVASFGGAANPAAGVSTGTPNQTGATFYSSVGTAGVDISYVCIGW